MNEVKYTEEEIARMVDEIKAQDEIEKADGIPSAVMLVIVIIMALVLMFGAAGILLFT